ncbi:MAG: hypothetical protein DKT66_13695 [Candidatus Melainabacteria bacterium]|nr:MAG: hypothetical protein DKT66_13695 [Candidatus Melainabacteria bacterium]
MFDCFLLTKSPFTGDSHKRKTCSSTKTPRLEFQRQNWRLRFGYQTFIATIFALKTWPGFSLHTIGYKRNPTMKRLPESKNFSIFFACTAGTYLK